MIKSAVNVLATWAWGSDIESSGISAQFCLENFFPIPPMNCLISIFMKVLGIAIIFGACLNKAPVILNIVNNKSVAGMSASSVYSETLMYSNFAFYSVLKGNPFTAYGETLIITFQSLIVISLCWTYAAPRIGMLHRLIAIAVCGVYLFGVFYVLPPTHYYLLLSANMPVLIFSRGSQIYTFYKCKHTGTQSLITTIMNTSGSMIRVVTTIFEIGFDMPILNGYFISLALNFTLILQFIMYKKNTKEYLKALKKKGE